MDILVGEYLAVRAIKARLARVPRPDLCFNLTMNADTPVLLIDGESFELPEHAGASNQQAVAIANDLIEAVLCTVDPALLDRFQPMKVPQHDRTRTLE